MTTKYIHLRQATLFGEPLHHGGFTVAYDVIQNNDGSVEKIVYALSACHYKDRYDKIKGRVISEGRLHSRRGNKVRVLSYAEDKTITEQVLRDIEDLSQNDREGFTSLLMSAAERNGNHV